MLIGFIGKMGSGKSTAADFLVEHYKFTKHNFKDGLDDELRELYPRLLEMIEIEGRLEFGTALSHKPTSPVVRELKQKHGTEVRRAQDPDYWVKKWLNTYQCTLNENVCVDDVRFLNEVDVIKNLGGIVVRIVRDDIVDTGNHASETALDGYDADFTVKAEAGDHAMLQMSLEKIIEDDTRNREEDSNHSGAYAEYAEGVVGQGSK